MRSDVKFLQALSKSCPNTLQSPPDSCFDLYIPRKTRAQDCFSLSVIYKRSLWKCSGTFGELPRKFALQHGAKVVPIKFTQELSIYANFRLPQISTNHHDGRSTPLVSVRNCNQRQPITCPVTRVFYRSILVIGRQTVTTMANGTQAQMCQIKRTKTDLNFYYL